MSWLRDFTTYQGRLRRSQFLWRHFVLSFVAAFGATALILPISLLTNISVVMAVVMAVIMPPLIYADLSLVVRRFHDVGLSGWWVTPIMALALLSVSFPFWPIPQEWMIAVLLPVNLIYFIILLVWPGTRGSNRFGDPSPARD